MNAVTIPSDALVTHFAVVAEAVKQLRASGSGAHAAMLQRSTEDLATLADEVRTTPATTGAPT